MKKNLGIIIMIVIGIMAIKYSTTASNQPIVENEEMGSTVQNNSVDNSIVSPEILLPEILNGNYIATADSQVFWVGKGLGKQHAGSINLSSGNLTVVENSVSGLITLDMNSISSDTGPGLDEHLKNEDFFDVQRYPEAFFAISELTQDSIKGDLTIKDIAKEVVFPLSIISTDSQVALSAETSINRTDWGITYNSSNFFADLGDRVIEDFIDIEFAIIFEYEQ